MDDVIFADNGPREGMSISLQRVASLRRRAQALATAASHWLRFGSIVQGAPGAKLANHHCLV